MSLRISRTFFSCFNTSHVVVYLEENKKIEVINWFQYISCCSLSIMAMGVHPIDLEFQYISCCSLSRRLNQPRASISCFNTSHVVVYPTNVHHQAYEQKRFNTSHVVVYPALPAPMRQGTTVSIHLML